MISDKMCPFSVLFQMASTRTSCKGKGPYNKVLKAKVVAVEASPRKYYENDGADKSSLTSAISAADM